jgi:DNA repair exonuclease SbcCD nuclease subunit
MIRTKVNNKRPTAILTSDWHLRETTPVCRTDNYWEEQWRKVDFISDLQKKYNCPVWNGGDLFDKWKPSPMLLSEASKYLPDNFISVAGQHDLPQHNLDLMYKSGIYNLMINRRLSILQNGHWEQSLGDGRTGFIIKGKQATVQHIMCYKGQIPWPGCTSPSAIRLLKKYPQFDLIVTGDNHQTFTQEYQGRWLVNPGSLMRMDADQVDHKPCVFLWYAEDNSIKQIFIPIKQNVINRDHIDKVKNRDGRIDAFVSRLDGNWEAKVSFEENLKTFKEKNNIRKSVMDIVYKAIEPIKN